MLRHLDNTIRVGIARLIVGAAFLLAIIAVGIYVAKDLTPLLVDDWVLHNVMGASISGIVVWLALPDRPRNGALWVLVWVSLFSGLQTFGAALGLAVTGIPSSDIDSGAVELIPSDLELFGAVGFLLAQAVWVPAIFLLLTLGILLFPNGNLPSARWRWVARFSVVATAGFTGFLAWNARPWSSDPYFTPSSSLGLGVGLLFGAVLASVIASVIGLVLRFRRSSGEVRQQFRWVTWGFSILALVTAIVMPFDLDLYRIVSLPAVTLLGVAYGIAISRYRLYEIDVVVNRSIVFAVLAGFITGVYAIVVVGLGSWVGAGTSSLPLSIAATALVAVVFEPVRHWIQRIANRLVYGSRATPYEVLADLTARLASAESTDGLLERMVRRLAEGTGAAGAWLRLEGEALATAVWPPDVDEIALDGEFTVPIVGGERVLGSLSVVKARGESLTPTEQGLVEDLAGSAAMVLNKVRLDTDLEARAEELRLSRRRLVDDQRRRRGDGVEQGAPRHRPGGQGRGATPLQAPVGGSTISAAASSATSMTVPSSRSSP